MQINFVIYVNINILRFSGEHIFTRFKKLIKSDYNLLLKFYLNTAPQINN